MYNYLMNRGLERELVIFNHVQFVQYFSSQVTKSYVNKRVKVKQKQKSISRHLVYFRFIQYWLLAF